MFKIKLLKALLILSAIYFLIAAFCHFWGWTIFPFYDGRLYSPYHDTLIALCDLIFFALFLSVARNPIKNRDTLNVIIFGFALAIIFNLGIIWKIDFELLGSATKKIQTVYESILAAIMMVGLLILRPKKEKN